MFETLELNLNLAIMMMINDTNSASIDRWHCKHTHKHTHTQTSMKTQTYRHVQEYREGKSNGNPIERLYSINNYLTNVVSYWFIQYFNIKLPPLLVSHFKPSWHIPNIQMGRWFALMRFRWIHQNYLLFQTTTTATETVMMMMIEGELSFGKGTD